MKLYFILLNEKKRVSGVLSPDNGSEPSLMMYNYIRQLMVFDLQRKLLKQLFNINDDFTFVIVY